MYLEYTVYPKKYAHGFVVLCFVVVMQSFILNSHEVFIHIHQGCFAGTGAIVRLPQCQWSKPDGYGKISRCITTTKHSKAKTVCIFLGIYCNYITMTSYEGNGVLNHIQLDFLFSLFRLIMKKTPKLHWHYWPFVRRIHRWPVDFLHKGLVMWKAFPCLEIMMDVSHHDIGLPLHMHAHIFNHYSIIHTYI